MADRTKHVGVTPVNNPLLSAAGNLFPFENFASAAQLVPISQRGAPIPLSEDVGEVDSFLGQDALPSIPLPGVLPPELKKPSAEQLQPITFYNAQGQPTGGAGLDFLSPVGVSPKSSESTFLARHKQFASRRRPVVHQVTTSSPTPSLPPVAVTSLSSLKSQSTQFVPAPSEPLSIESVPSHPPLPSSKVSPLLQEPDLVSKTLLLPPKSQSTPPSPTTQIHLPTSSSQTYLAVSKSQPPTASPSPSHKPQISPLVSQVLSSPIEEPTVSETWSSLLAQGKQASVSHSRNNVVQSVVAELAPVTEKPEKSSPETQFAPTSISETVPLESSSSVHSSEETGSHISTVPPTTLSNKPQKPLTKNQCSLSEISTSLTEVENLSSSSDLKSSKPSNTSTSNSEESNQASEYHSSPTVSLISATTAEALLSLSVGKRFSCSEAQSESLSAESLVLPALGASSLHFDQKEGKPAAVSDSESFPNQGYSTSFVGQSSSKEVSAYLDEKHKEKLVSPDNQEIKLGQSYFSSSENVVVSKASVESGKYQTKETTKVEDIPGHLSKTENIVASISTAEVVPSLPAEEINLNCSRLSVFESQHTDPHFEKVIHSHSNNSLATQQFPDLVTEHLTKSNQDIPDSALLSSQEKKPNTTKSFGSGVLPSATEATQLSPSTFPLESSHPSEARLPTTSELNSPNPPTPQHSCTTLPYQPSPNLGPQLVQSIPNQYFTPVEEPNQLPAEHPEKPSSSQFITPRAEPSQFIPHQPAYPITKQSFAQTEQSQSPPNSTPAYQQSQFSSKDPSQGLSQVYQSPLESNQFPTNQAGQPLQSHLPNLSTPNQAPLYFTPTAPIKQPPTVQLGQPPPSQFYTPTATSQTPLSHFTTSTSTRHFPGQYFTPKSSHFHYPSPPSQGSQPPTSQVRQEFTNQYLISTNHPPVHIFTPTAQASHSAQDQPLTPSVKVGTTPSYTPPIATYPPNSQFAYLPPHPPSNHSLPPPSLASSTPPPGQFLPPPPSSTPSQFPHATPTLTPSTTGLPPPPKSNFASSPHVNQYSIHAKSQHSRRPYISPAPQPQRDYFKPSPLPPLPAVQSISPPTPIIQQTPPTTFLVPNQSSAPSSLFPLSATAAPSVPDNHSNQPVTFLVPNQSFAPSPLAPTSAAPIPPVPKNRQNQPVTCLTQNQSSSPSPLSSVSLTPAATPPAPSSSTVNSGSVSSQFPPPGAPLPTAPPPSLAPTFPPPQPRQTNHNPFSARATPPPPGSLQQKLPAESVSLPPPPSVLNQPQSVPFSPLGNSESVLSHSSAVPLFRDNQPYSSAQPPTTFCSTQSGAQEHTRDLNFTVDSLSSEPYNSSARPPSGISEGGPKNYRLGKQRPRYAQLPDLAVSPLAVSPIYSPNSSESLYGAKSLVPEPYPIYPPGSQQLIESEDYLVPTEDSASDRSEGIPSSFFNLATQPGSAAASASGGSNSYRPVYWHWFFKKEVETKVLWKPFSLVDSLALESACNAGEANESTVVPTDGGRYDVNVSQRQRTALFWEEKKPTEVRRCSWFYKGPLDSRYTPYEEEFAAKLEDEYKSCTEANKWNRKIEHNGETVVMHGPVVMVHYSPTGSSDQLGVPSDTSPVKPRVVKRGVEEFEIEEGEPAKVDHLLFLVHGIGSVCDLRFRDVVETVDDFRSLALQLTRSHFSLSVEKNQVNRVEVLPVSWHWKLHGEDTGIDRKLNSITLKSIPRLRNFTNDTLLDILFYTSPVYCQTIMDTVGNEMNRMYELFLRRNPDFNGSVSVGGHSLGSLILFDLLYHQKVPKNPRSSPSIIMTAPGVKPPDTSPDKDKQSGKVPPKKAMEDGEEPMEEEDILSDEAMPFSRSSNLNRRASCVNYMIGIAGTGQPHISYPQLNFKPENFFALGSPIGMFVTVRGIETLGDNFHLPTCPGFFNIFHPFDPVAYRIESLIDPELAPSLKPVIIPHHKGRKRMHLELKETVARMSSDLKNKLVDSVKNTWNTMTQYSMFSRPEASPKESEVIKALEAHLGPATVSAPVDIGADTESEGGDADADVTLGCLNRGRRVDYVLQEAPLESFNEYLFALQSHVCYWESEDTMLMILTEIYHASDVKPDSVLTGADRERSPMKILSDQFLASASPPKPQFSALRFPSSTSLSSEGSSSSLGVSRSQSVPKMMNDPNLATLSTSSPGYLESMGQPPQLGMDPTAPMTEAKNLAPPPTMGFVKQALQRK